MQVKKKDLIQALDTVKPGLAKRQIIEQSTHFVFADDEVVTYNGNMSIIHPFKTGLSCSAPADELYKILGKITQDEVTLSHKNDELKIDGGNVRGAVSTRSGSELLDNVKDLGVNKIKTWTPLPKDFLEGMELCIFSASKDMSDPVMTGLYIDQDTITSSDRFRVSRYILDGEVKKPFLLPAKVAAELIDYQVVEYCIKDWVFFRTKGGTIIASRLILSRDYPDMNEVLKVSGTKLVLPKDFDQAVETAMVMLEADTASEKLIDVQLAGHSIKCRGQKALGWIERELEKGVAIKENVGFSINPDFLLIILKHTHQMIFANDNRKVVFKADNFVHLIAIKEMQ
jgi:hypothetical protein